MERDIRIPKPMTNLAVSQPLPEPTPEQLLTLIFHYISRIPRERNLDHLLVMMADMGRDMVSACSCTLWMVDFQQRVLWSKVSHQLGRVALSLDKGVAASVALTGLPALLNDPYQDPRFDPEIDRRYQFRTRNLIALPVLSSTGEVIGVFQAVNKMTAAGRFTEQDKERLQLAASYMGMELEAAFLQNELEETEREIIVTLAETGEVRSKETGQHVKRVAEFCALLGKKAGLSRSEVRVLKMASPLHDIGKIAVPDTVLLKPGKLTDDEMTIMRTHASLGYDILKHSQREVLRAAAIIAHQHHEKWDGSGYPQKLAGEQIHIYGRIAAIADVFDALANDRCYKKAWPIPAILDFFEQESGKHFDPNLMEIFLGAVSEFIAILEEYKD